MPFGLGKILFGVLVGFFVIPAIVTDPQGTIDTTTQAVEKLVEVATFVGGLI